MEQNLFKKKESLAAIGFIFLNLLILGLGTWFLTSKIINASKFLEEKKAALDAVFKGWEQMAHEQRDLQKIKPQLEQIDSALVSPEEPIEFINSLENLAQKTSNLYQINVATQPAQKGKASEAKSLSLQISLAGSFTNLMHFLKYLENLKYFTQVESLQISQASGAIAGKPEWKEVPPGSASGVINLKAFIK